VTWLNSCVTRASREMMAPVVATMLAGFTNTAARFVGEREALDAAEVQVDRCPAARG
jgi:hypothetical protein